MLGRGQSTRPCLCSYLDDRIVVDTPCAADGPFFGNRRAGPCLDEFYRVPADPLRRQQHHPGETRRLRVRRARNDRIVGAGFIPGLARPVGRGRFLRSCSNRDFVLMFLSFL